jgi:hypothetical protein
MLLRTPAVRNVQAWGFISAITTRGRNDPGGWASVFVTVIHRRNALRQHHIM